MLFKYRFQGQDDGTPVTFYARDQKDIGLVIGSGYEARNVIPEQGKNPLIVARAKLQYDGWKDMLNTGRDGVLEYEISPELLVFLNTERLGELAHDVVGMDLAGKLCRLNSCLYLPNDLAARMKGHDWMSHAEELLLAYESAVSRRGKPSSKSPERKESSSGSNLSDGLGGSLPGAGNSKYWPGTSYIDKGVFGKSGD